MKTKKPNLTIYIITQVVKSLLYIGVLVLLFIFLKNYAGYKVMDLVEPFTAHPYLMLLIFLLSELIIGIIPPEFFILWAFKYDFRTAILFIGILAFVSLLAGILNFFAGKNIQNIPHWQKKIHLWIGKYKRRFDQFGGILVGLSAMTPIPFSATSLISGLSGYPTTKYLAYASLRLVRFTIYAFVIYEAGDF